jgi:hypothetical protein
MQIGSEYFSGLGVNVFKVYWTINIVQLSSLAKLHLFETFSRTKFETDIFINGGR